MGAGRHRETTPRVAYTIPTYEPSQGQAGESWFWDISYPDFPADESWELSYYLRGPVDLDFAFGTEVTAGDGAEFEVRVPATTTDDLTAAGAYRLIGRVSKSGEVHTVYNEHFLVLADPSTAVNVKSFARQMLEAIDTALIAGVASSAETKRLTINGRTIEYRDTADLEGRRAHYAVLVALEDNPYGSVTHVAEFVRG